MTVKVNRTVTAKDGDGDYVTLDREGPEDVPWRFTGIGAAVHLSADDVLEFCQAVIRIITEEQP